MAETQPVLPAEDELLPVLHPMPIVPNHTAILPVPPVLNPAPTDADPILSTNYEYNWYKYNNPDNLPRNGRVRDKKWGIQLPTGDRLDQYGDISKDYSFMDYFFFSFPSEKINLTIRLTNSCLHVKGNKLLDERDFYKFLGIIILITRHEFTSRAKFWSLHRSSLHISSNLCLNIPVILPSFTAGMYLYSDVGNHKFALEVNSSLVINIIIPRNL